MNFSQFRNKYERAPIDVRPNTLSDPLVSVCVQTFQHKEYISQCLDSILSQKTDFVFEILIGEDCSTDGTREICLDYKLKYPDKITLLLHDRANNIRINNRPTGRFNFMYNLFSAKGKYIAFCEGDDYWTDDNKLSKQVAILESNVDCIACHHWQRLAVKNQYGIFEEVDAPTNGHGYLNETKVSVSEIFRNRLRPKFRTILFRNTISTNGLPGWFAEVQFGDEPLNFILGKSGDFYFLNKEMAVYRQTDAGSSSVFRNKEGYILGNLEWIRIWCLSLNFYDQKFAKEAAEGIDFFMNRLILQKDLNISDKKQITLFILNQLPLSLFLKVKFIMSLLLGVKL